jgi:hypothetical protein
MGKRRQELLAAASWPFSLGSQGKVGSDELLGEGMAGIWA